MPVSVTFITNDGHEVQFNKNFNSLEDINKFIRGGRKASPTIVRVVIDIALPVNGDIP